MKEIKIKVRPFKDDRAWREEDLAKRIASVVVGTDRHCSRQKSGYSWMLDAGNDWFMDCRDADSGTVSVLFRYGGGNNEKALDALQVFLQWAIGHNVD